MSRLTDSTTGPEKDPCWLPCCKSETPQKTEVQASSFRGSSFSVDQDISKLHHTSGAQTASHHPRARQDSLSDVMILAKLLSYSETLELIRTKVVEFAVSLDIVHVIAY